MPHTYFERRLAFDRLEETFPALVSTDDDEIL